tara:strand:+ start:258 stop:422 length:165 start_codon:yes stop_codon:yes gene_type:complete
MLDSELRLEVNKQIIHSGFKKSENLLSPISNIIKMRHSNIERSQILKVTREALA